MAARGSADLEVAVDDALAVQRRQRRQQRPQHAARRRRLRHAAAQRAAQENTGAAAGGHSGVRGPHATKHYRRRSARGLEAGKWSLVRPAAGPPREAGCRPPASPLDCGAHRSSDVRLPFAASCCTSTSRAALGSCGVWRARAAAGTALAAAPRLDSSGARHAPKPLPPNPTVPPPPLPPSRRPPPRHHANPAQALSPWLGRCAPSLCNSTPQRPPQSWAPTREAPDSPTTFGWLSPD
jgi:hypothetical protein